MFSPSKMNGAGSIEDQYENPFADSYSNANDRTALIEPDLDLTGQSTTTSAPVQQPQKPETPVPTGNIGNNQKNTSNSSSSNTQQPTASSSSNVYTGEDTLDEAVTVTIVRSILA
jgi:hypothetical protein